MRVHPIGHIPDFCLPHLRKRQLVSSLLMRIWLIGLLALAALTRATPVFAQGTGAPTITSPTAGQILQGQVAITGTTNVANFASAELAFAYASDTTGTWFTILASTQFVVNDVLATWDTTAVTDGDYVLRLKV